MITAPPRTELKLQESHPARQIAERDNQDGKIWAVRFLELSVPRPARLKISYWIGSVLQAQASPHSLSTNFGGRSKAIIK